MQKLNQQHEMQVFNQQNAVRIAAAEEVLFAKAKELLEGEAQKALQRGTLQAAADAIARKQLSRLHSILRYRAVEMCAACGSDRYWAWIDATGQLLDATGCQWPYLTQEDRTRYLSWVQITLDERWQCAA